MADATTETAVVPPEEELIVEPVTWDGTRFSLTLAIDDRPIVQIGLDIGVRKEDSAVLMPIIDQLIAHYEKRRSKT